jgi:hypothetical protein
MVILTTLALLLLVNVMIPQASVVGAEASRTAAEGGALGHFLVETLGFDSVATSPIFLGTLSLFFLNLASVLLDRARVTFNRTRVRAPARDTLARWVEKESTLRGGSAVELSGRAVLSTMRGLGFRGQHVDEGVAWGVKNRRAALGFLVFHISFFFICLGGVSIYYTRFVGTVKLVEGQAFESYGSIVREAPRFTPSNVQFSLHEVDPFFEEGEPVRLKAVLYLVSGGRAQRGVSRVNHPAQVGFTKILVTRAGLAPVLWFQDRSGFTVDRVAAVASTGLDEPVVLVLANSSLTCSVQPLVEPGTFPGRDSLEEVRVVVRLNEESTSFEEVELEIGQWADIGPYRVVLEDVRYWAQFYVVSERGGGLLIVGFCLASIGLVWRLVFHRREVAVAWSGKSFAIAGRAEYFSGRFKTELETLSGMLAGKS